MTRLAMVLHGAVCTAMRSLSALCTAKSKKNFFRDKIIKITNLDSRKKALKIEQISKYS